MKTVLVTGGSRGIGAEIVRKFAKNGYTVIVNYNNSQQKAEDLRKDLLKEGCDVHLLRADVSCENDVIAMYEYVSKYFKKLNVLINNAGVALNQTLIDTTSAQYDNVMNVNCKGAFLLCKYMLPLLQKADNASIVNMSSIWGIYGASCESVYAMSKHAIIGLTKSLAEELQFSGIKVNCVCPPIVLTDMAKELTQNDKDEFCQRFNTQVLTAEQVASEVYDTALSDKSGQVVILGFGK